MITFAIKNHTYTSYGQNTDSYIPWQRYRQRTALLRTDDAPRAHRPLLFPMGYVHSQYPRKFPHRAILYLIGLFYTLSARFNLSTEIRLLLTTGLCGGFTTFSTFSNDGLILIKQGFYGMFALYTLLSITLGVLAAFAGGTFGRCI